MGRTTFAARLAAETAVAAVLAVAAGALLAWVGFISLTAGVGGLLPFGLSVGAFMAYAFFRLSRHEVPAPAFALAVILGLLVVTITSAVLIVMVGCRWGSCINL